ncbi:hypothetical protein ACNF40_07555 [Cuniculiplasma sp. SKW4]|uniref:hypothetical protein n=1 Tax=Cuniculiplasma sp. SKW4 TaxID=3400171 RepID=UPI003FD332C0
MVVENQRKLKLETFLNRVLSGDSIDVMKQIPDNSIDLIFSDSLYNLQLDPQISIF